MTTLKDAIADLLIDDILPMVQARLDRGDDPLDVLRECSAGMDIVGERYKAEDYFLSELVVAGEMFTEAMKLIEPLLAARTAGDAKVGIVIGTVKGDIHNIGKDIAAVLLKAAGFEVHDLGVDVTPRAFVDKLKQTGACILGLSGLLTPAFESMRQTVEAVAAAGLRDKVKIILGGGVVTEGVLTFSGADAFTRDAMEGVAMCKRFAELA
jgi:methanogenic corrinoid protein MtbC1